MWWITPPSSRCTVGLGTFSVAAARLEGMASSFDAGADLAIQLLSPELKNRTRVGAGGNVNDSALIAGMANESARACRREEVLGINHRIVNSGVHSQVFFSALWSTITQGKVWHGEIRNKAKNLSLY